MECHHKVAASVNQSNIWHPDATYSGLEPKYDKIGIILGRLMSWLKVKLPFCYAIQYPQKDMFAKIQLVQSVKIVIAKLDETS